MRLHLATSLAILAFVIGVDHSQAAPIGEVEAGAAMFRSYCLSTKPEYSALTKQASEAKYSLVRDDNVPVGKGYIRQRNWLVPTANGSNLLIAADTRNGSTHVVGCGVAVADGDGETMVRLLSADARLGEPTKRVAKTSENSNVVWWNAHVPGTENASSQVTLSYDVPGMSGVIVNLIVQSDEAMANP